MTNDLPTLRAPADMLPQLRKLIPQRPLTYGQALTLAERQAGAVRRLLGNKQAALDLSWLFTLEEISVTFRPEYRMPDHTSGLTTRMNDVLTIVMNASEGRLRQRFTLAHELKHVLDFDLVDTTYSKLGRGDAKRQGEQIEWICNRFAACLLMPKVWLNRLWTRGIQDPLALAHVFQVSAEAMAIRLETLGFASAPEPPRDTFFRQTVVPAPMLTVPSVPCSSV